MEHFVPSNHETLSPIIVLPVPQCLNISCLTSVSDGTRNMLQHSMHIMLFSIAVHCGCPMYDGGPYLWVCCFVFPSITSYCFTYASDVAVHTWENHMSLGAREAHVQLFNFGFLLDDQHAIAPVMHRSSTWANRHSPTRGFARLEWHATISTYRRYLSTYRKRTTHRTYLHTYKWTLT